MNDSARCFLAVKMPPGQAAALHEAQARLRATEGDWKWVDPGTFHITLKFLGNVERGTIPELWASVSQALRDAQRFRMEFRGLGVFPNARAPRVAWAGVDAGAAELRELAGKVETACAAHGFEQERRPFRAHLTLGRARRPRPSPALTAIIAEMAEADLGETVVDRVFLMESTLTPRGPVYGVLEEHLLDHGEGE